MNQQEDLDLIVIVGYAVSKGGSLLLWVLFVYLIWRHLRKKS